MHSDRLRQMLEGPLLLSDEARVPGWLERKSRRGDAALSVPEEDVEWEVEGIDAPPTFRRSEGRS